MDSIACIDNAAFLWFHCRVFTRFLREIRKGEDMDLRHQDTYFLGFVALPSSEVTEVALGLAREITGRTRLSGCIQHTRRPPHVTLFQGCFPATNIARPVMQPALRSPLLFQMAELVLRPNGNVFWCVKPSRALTEAHLRLHRTLHPYTEGKLAERFRHMAQDPALPVAEREHIRTYGSVLAGPRFTPHITLGCALDPVEAAHVLQDIRFPLREFAFQVRDLNLALLESDGSVSHVFHS